MAKPILVIKIPESNLQKFIQQGFTKQWNLRQELTNEYHILITPTEKLEVNFELLNAPDATDIELEELKKIVFEEIKK